MVNFIKKFLVKPFAPKQPYTTPKGCKITSSDEKDIERRARKGREPRKKRLAFLLISISSTLESVAKKNICFP